jgi:hypothetical protein
MSEESTTADLVALTRRAYESFSRRDLDAVMREYDEDSVLDLSPAGLGNYEGPGGDPWLFCGVDGRVGGV